MKYKLNDQSTRPAYMQLYALIRDDIIDGVYKLGDKLPSKRIMADNTAVSVVEYDDSFVPHIVSQNDASHLNPEVSTFEKQDWWRPEKKKGSA